MNFKQIVIIISSLSIFNVQANLSNFQKNEINSAFDNLNFELNVNWDQENQDFYNDQINYFTNKLQNIQNDGASNFDLIRYTEKKLSKQKVKLNVSNLVNNISALELTDDETLDYIKNSVQNSTDTGAHWLGGTTALKIVAAVAIIVGLVLIIKKISEDDEPVKVAGTGKTNATTNTNTNTNTNVNTNTANNTAATTNTNTTTNTAATTNTTTSPNTNTNTNVNIDSEDEVEQSHEVEQIEIISLNDNNYDDFKIDDHDNNDDMDKNDHSDQEDDNKDSEDDGHDNNEDD